MPKPLSFPLPVRWGILGVGDVTEVKSGPPYRQTEGFELGAVMRRNFDKAQDYAQRHGVAKYYNNADALIHDPDIDAIYIATPPDSHMHYALKVAAAGKPCCIEKPLTPRYSESLVVYQAFQARQIPLFVAYYRRTLPRFTQVKTWLDEGYIGNVRQIQWQLSKAPSEQDLSGEYNWRTDAKVAPGGYFDDLASHGLDLFAYYFGKFKQVEGFSLNQQGLYQAKDALNACWLHESGVLGTGNWNFGVNHSEDLVQIHGSKGKISFAIFHDKPLIIESEKLTEERYVEHPTSVQQFHVEAMRDVLTGKLEEHPSTGETALHTSWVMDKIINDRHF